MLRVRVWVLCEYHIWTKNHVQWTSQIKTIINNNNNNINNNNNNNDNINLFVAQKLQHSVN